MSYDVIRLAAEKLSYREKMKLSQYLIQAAIKEDLITIEIQPALAIAVAWEPFEFQLWLNQLPSTPD